ncbi:MAG: rRNA m(5)U939 methyltransferase [Proteobacteria bacterium]|nr:rRNA m(5)U939 methyltransferase [Pseudomonadota bacterium]
MPVGRIESLDHEARGVTRREGKAIFVDGALPGECVEYASFRKKPNFEMAHLVQVLQASSQRVMPLCPHFNICGGCALQHMESSAQVAVKQRVLEDNLWHIGRVRPEEILSPVHGSPWAYRHRARLGVRKVSKKAGMLIGFHEKRSSYIADMRSCAVLPPHVSDLLMPLRTVLAKLSVSERLPQVELAVGERCTALVLRILEPLNVADKSLLREFADRYGVAFYLQPKGPDSAYLFYPPEARLSYVLPEFGLELDFRPTEFTQVNHAVNRILVRRAMRLLDPQPGERIADMFCGLGNFSLPMARLGADVLGLEGSQGLMRRAVEGALANGLQEKAHFAVANLFECTTESLAALGSFDKMLIDPPREGAIELIKALPENCAPRRIVYVSCNPATLARDAGVLVHVQGYRFRAIGAVNMFPQTAHVESVALFEK